MTCWYVFVGGTAIFGVMDGSGLAEVIASEGSGIATFAFLDTLPLGAITKWIFIVMAVMTFVTFADAICYSFPLMFLKNVTKDAADNYDAMETSILCWGLPSSALIVLFAISSFKFLLNRKKYDVTYQEELEEAGQSEAADCEEIPFPADEAADTEIPTAEA